MVEILLNLSKFGYLFSGTLTIGFLLALTFFAINKEGEVKEEFKKLRGKISLLASIYVVCTLIFIVTTLASILDVNLVGALNITMMRSFVTQISLGKFLFLQACLGLLVAISSIYLRKVTTAAALLAITLVSITLPVFQSHASSGGSHLIAVGTLVIHVLSITLWVGGLSAIVILKSLHEPIYLKRYSKLAFWAALTVVASGLINAWIRMDFLAAWKGTYAILLIEKIVLTLLLLTLAAYARKNLDKNIGKLLAFESAIMVLTIFIGTLLSNTQPVSRSSKLDPIEALVGLKYPGKPDLQKWILVYQPDALVLGLLIITALLYLKGIRILKKRGDHWPPPRTVSFLFGLLIINYAINGAVGVYAHFGFSYHMIEHMILGMIAPIPLVLGAPITLALRTLPGGRDENEEGVRTLLVRILHSRYMKIITNPVVALLIFDGSLFVLYFTGLFGNLMGSHLGHLFMNLHFLLAGALFFHVIVGIDPNPNRPPNVVRIVILFAAMSIHAFFSIALMSATTLLDGGYYTAIGNPMHLKLLENQYTGGAIGWAMGEIPILIALSAAFIQWMRDDKKESKRIDKNAARASAMGEHDDLSKYNQYLAELARLDKDDLKNRRKEEK